jgi:eukaryotic translation initiation factor 2C
MRRQVPPEQTSSVLEFSTKKPHERMQSIINGLQVLEYGQSPYLRSFDMNVDASRGPLDIHARILQPPTLRYGQGSKQPTIVFTHLPFVSLEAA